MAPQVMRSHPAEGDKGGQHREVLDNFVAAVLDGVPLIAEAREGGRSVALANAILMSSVEGGPIDLPFEPARYERMLAGLVAAETPIAEGVPHGQPKATASS